jgi:retron-type reverse transcriptase
MPKTFKHLYSQITDFQNLFLASRKAQKGRRYRESTMRFNFDLEANLFCIQDELKSKSYRHGYYRDFIVLDSKKRLISAAPYRDRVVHHAVNNIIEPLFDRSFINDTFACRKGKGTHAALLRFRHFLAKHKYVLKCDIKKYFQNIDHQILLAKLARKLFDREAMWLLTEIIGSRDFNKQTPAVYYPGDNLFTPHERRRGIPVGNLTSQFFANLYLNDFDHWLKEDLRAGPYLRYVDDFCIFGDDKYRLNEVRANIEEYLAGIRLSMHEGKSRIYSVKEGVEFLGFRHLHGRVRVRRENVRRFIKRMRKMQKAYAAGEIEFEKVRDSVSSWSAHAAYADSFRFRELVIPSFTFSRG